MKGMDKGGHGRKFRNKDFGEAITDGKRLGLLR
jgi:hypothetical protein